LVSDWSSDVCSSDLVHDPAAASYGTEAAAALGVDPARVLKTLVAAVHGGDQRLEDAGGVDAEGRRGLGPVRGGGRIVDVLVELHSDPGALGGPHGRRRSAPRTAGQGEGEQGGERHRTRA